MGTRGSFPGGKAAGRVADQSPPSNAEVKNAWSYNSTPPIRPHGVVLSSSTGGQAMGSLVDFNDQETPCPERQVHDGRSGVVRHVTGKMFLH
jgi:hypothetical protein